MNHKYYTTITTYSPYTYDVSDSNHNFLNSLQITLIIVNTTFQNSALPANDNVFLYMVVTK